MYKMYKKDRGQWVEVASFDDCSRARYYARRLNFVEVDNPHTDNEYYYQPDTWKKDYAILKDEIKNIDDIDSYDLLNDYGVAVCENCSNYFGLKSSDEYQEIDGNYYCCSDCIYEGGYEWCSHCETYFNRDDAWTTHSGETICHDCYYDYYGTCASCDEIWHQDDLTYDEDNDEYYCPNCYEETDSSSLLHCYHSHNRPAIEIHRTENDKPYDNTIGTEVETECKGNYKRTEVIEKVNDIVNKDDTMFMFEEDGSLSSHGYETISMPFTMNWFHEHKEMFEKMFSTMVSMGCRSHDTTTCGFHVHFGRHFFGSAEEECISRLIYLFEKYKQQLEVFSRRKEFSWCRFPSDRDFWEDDRTDWKDLKSIKAKKNKSCLNGHNNVINLQNSKTIEIRLFKGTLNFQTYTATLELVNNIVTYVRDKSDEEVENGSFNDIINYLPTECLKQYCLDRNII